MTDEQIDILLERFDLTEPNLQRKIVARLILDQGIATNLTSLAYRLAVAYHMRSHAGIGQPEFDACHRGFCGEWHQIQRLAKSLDDAQDKKTNAQKGGE